MPPPRKVLFGVVRSGAGRLPGPEAGAREPEQLPAVASGSGKGIEQVSCLTTRAVAMAEPMNRPAGWALPDHEDDLADVSAAFHEGMAVGRPVEGKHRVHDGTHPPRLE